MFRIQQQSASQLYEISTSCGKVTADKIIVTAGAWANQVSSSIVVNFTLFLLQKHCPAGKGETEEHEKDNREQWEGGCYRVDV